MVFLCPKTECPNDETLKNGEKCPLCGALAENFGQVGTGNLFVAKAEYKTEKDLIQHKNALDAKVLISSQMTDEDIINKITEDMENLVMHEAGTAWMRLGTLLSGSSTDAMIGAGFKALIDQNKIIIRQNELLLRNLKRIVEKGQVVP